jgi:hypothetical protein
MIPNAKFMRRAMAALLFSVANLSVQSCGGGGSSAASAPIITPPPTAATSWTINCLDNQCISVTDKRLTSGQSFLVSTLSPGGAALGSYTLSADATNSVNFRPASYGELTLLNSSAGLSISIAPLGSGQSPIIVFSAYKAVTGFLNSAGSNSLILNLNANPLISSSSYSVEFLDSNHDPLQTLTSVTPTNSTLAIDFSTLMSSVTTAYNGNGIYVVLTNSQNQILPGDYYTNANDMGALNDFYSGTQLQGELALTGQGLINVQGDLGYLLAPNVDVPYVPRFANEIPFAHTLSITRFLGGYTQAAVQLVCGGGAGTTTYASYCTPAFSPSSLDYVVQAGASLNYQTALMLDRISPYLNAGYSPNEMTLVLINVPWAISSGSPPQNGSACAVQSTGGSLGIWGQCNPPASYSQWGAVITQLATDIQSTYQAGAADFRYEIGDEFDQSSTFNGQADDFYNLYGNAYASIQAVLPGASVAPGDFTSACYDSASTGASGCVYDSKSLLSLEVAKGVSPPYLTRSLNSFWDTSPNPYPSAEISSAVTSFAYVNSATANQLPLEIHQFGFLDMPWGADGSTSIASIQANWEFQTLMGLKKNLPNLARVFNWGGFATIQAGASLNFLEGAGYIRTIMDNHQGAELYMLPVTTGNLPVGNEVMAVALVEGNSFKLIISNVDVITPNSNLTLMQPDAPTQLSITIPNSWLGTTSWSYLRYSSAPVDNVFAQIKSDYSNAQPQSILAPNFSQCAVCFSDPMSMTTDAAAAQTILQNNWTSSSNYVQIMQNSLKWNQVTSVNAANQLNIDQNGVIHAFSQNGATVSVTVGPNEMLVLNPG